MIERPRVRLAAYYFFAYGAQNRPTGSLYDPISLGNVLALICPLALVLSASARTAAARFLALAALLLIGVALTLSLSRMSWIAAVAGVAVVIIAGLAIPTQIANRHQSDSPSEEVVFAEGQDGDLIADLDELVESEDSMALDDSVLL